MEWGSPLQNVRCGCGCSDVSEEQYEALMLAWEANNFGEDDRWLD